MSDPQPVSYYAQSAASPDDGYLRAISVCHYVWGGLTILFSSIFIVHFLMGVMIIRGTFPGVGPNAGNPGPPPEFGYLFAGMGGCAVLMGWLCGILTIASGRCISLRQRRIFSLVMAGINCCFVPFGTVLGVFTFILLLRPNVIQEYSPHPG